MAAAPPILAALRTVVAPHYAVYAAHWNDAQKGGLSSSSSCDVLVVDQRRRPVYTLRHQNWTQNLPQRKAHKLHLTVAGGGGTVPLDTFLAQVGRRHGADTAGMPQNLSLHCPTQVTPRIQVVFLDEATPFAVYVYQQRLQPYLTLLDTPKGTTVQRGSKWSRLGGWLTASHCVRIPHQPELVTFTVVHVPLHNTTQPLPPPSDGGGGGGETLFPPVPFWDCADPVTVTLTILRRVPSGIPSPQDLLRATNQLEAVTRTFQAVEEK